MPLDGLSQRYGNAIPAADQEGQGSTVRLPIGAGVDPADLMAPQSTRGSFSEEDDLTNPRGTADSAYGYGQRPRNPRQRRALAHDRRYAPAQDSGSFLDRFPAAGRIEIWGNR